MAVNWNAYEAAKKIMEGTDKEAIQDIGGRFPLFSRNVMLGGAGLLAVLKAIPKITARVVESGLKGEEGEETTEETKVTEDNEEKKEAPKKGGRGRKKAEPKTEEPDDDWGEDEEESTDKYEGKTARELYSMCKERGIKAEMKKPEKYYADLLRKADAEAEKAEDADDDWGEETEEEQPKKRGRKPAVKKAEPKAEKKSAKAKKEEPEDDWGDSDDDDWEI